MLLGDTGEEHPGATILALISRWSGCLVWYFSHCWTSWLVEILSCEQTIKYSLISWQMEIGMLREREKERERERFITEIHMLSLRLWSCRKSWFGTAGLQYLISRDNDWKLSMCAASTSCYKEMFLFRPDLIQFQKL